MAIYIKTTDPKALVDAINHAIDSRDIVTWSRDKEGDYTIQREQWRFKAWFRPQIDENRSQLVMSIVQSRKYPLTSEIYGVFHGRLVSTIVAHFSHIIENINVTPQPVETVDIFQTGE